MRTFTQLTLLAFLTIVLLPSASSGQSYHPMLTDSVGSWNIVNVYAVNNGTVIETDTVFYTAADTVLGGNTYRMVYNNLGLLNPVFVREDTAARQVFFWNNGVEILMYDFTLTLGDTITLWTQKKAWVTDTGTIQTTGGPRHYLKLESSWGDLAFGSTNYNNTGVWVMGVGDTLNNFVYPSHHPVFDQAIQVRCVHKEGLRVFGDQPCELNLTSRGVMVEEGVVSIFPQPSNGELRIEFPEEVIGIVKLELLDLQGRSVWQEERQGSGKHLVVDAGERVGDGLFVLRIVRGEDVFVRKVLFGR